MAFISENKDFKERASNIIKYLIRGVTNFQVQTPLYDGNGRTTVEEVSKELNFNASRQRLGVELSDKNVQEKTIGLVIDKLFEIYQSRKEERIKFKAINLDDILSALKTLKIDEKQVDMLSLYCMKLICDNDLKLSDEEEACKEQLRAFITDKLRKWVNYSQDYNCKQYDIIENSYSYQDRHDFLKLIKIIESLNDELVSKLESEFKQDPNSLLSKLDNPEPSVASRALVKLLFPKEIRKLFGGSKALQEASIYPDIVRGDYPPVAAREDTPGVSIVLLDRNRPAITVQYQNCQTQRKGQITLFQRDTVAPDSWQVHGLLNEESQVQSLKDEGFFEGKEVEINDKKIKMCS